MPSLAPLLLALALCAAPVCGQQATANDWGRIYAANNLDNDGHKPFHLVVEYQLYDLKGEPSEKGAIEEWWASPTSHHVTITGPSFPATSPSEKGSVKTTAELDAVRARLLVHMLADAIIRPVPRVDLRPGDKADEDTQQFGKVTLRCLHLQSASATKFRNACMESGTDTVRVMKSADGNESVTRNAIGKFRDLMVATKVTVGLVGKTAISGSITTLEVIDPAQHTDKLNLFEPPAALPRTDAENAARAGLKAGKIISRAQPIYPAAAKAEHIGGAVILAAVITKSGEVRRLTPIAASDPVFIAPAMEAVRQWKYEPYLLNGEATEVDTAITVNFTLTR